MPYMLIMYAKIIVLVMKFSAYKNIIATPEKEICRAFENKKYTEKVKQILGICMVKEKRKMYWIKIIVVVIAIAKVIAWLLSRKKNQMTKKFKSHKYIRK